MSSYYSPEAILTQKALDLNKHCKYSFGEYVKEHHETLNTNDMKERAIDAIYLCLNDNMQGGHVCMNLSTGKRITKNKITPVPLSEVVKNRVEQMVTEQGITHVKFTNKKGIKLPNVDWIAGVDYDIDYDEINDHDKDDTDEYQQDVDENCKCR